MGTARIRYALLSGVAGLVWGGAAQAQTAPEPAAPLPTASASVQPGTEPTTIGEVIVTATHRSEAIQKVPQTLTAVTGEQLNQLNAHTLGDIASFVPGLTTVSSGGQSLVIIRGVETAGALTSTVGLYLDDIPLGGSTPFGLGQNSFNVNTFDLSRLEVLNGPQGTLFGSNSLGGTLRYITAAPDPRGFSAQGEAEVSSTEHGGVNDGFRMYVNAPLPKDMGAVRLDLLDEYTSGYMDDPTYHRENQGSFRNYGFRGSVLLTPTPDFSLRLTAFSQNVPSEGATTEFINPATGKPAGGAYQQQYPLSQPVDYSLNLGSATADWNLHWAKLTGILGYQVFHGLANLDESLVYDPLLKGIGAGTDPFLLYVDVYTKKTTGEFRLTSNNNIKWLDWIVGYYHDFERTTEVVNLYDQKTAAGTLYGVTPFLDRAPSTYEENAVYADATLHFTSRLSLGLGVRYSVQDQVYYDSKSGLLATGSVTVVTRPLVKTQQSVPTYLINPKYQLTDNSQIYVRVANGFRPGGPNFIYLNNTKTSSFTADSLWNYELGEKTTFLDKRATLNLDVYDIEWSNIQQVVNINGTNQIVNSGDARIRGVEGAAGFKVTPAFTLTGSATYSDARLTTPATLLGLTTAGARLPYSPRYNFALLAAYDFKINSTYAGRVTLADRYIAERNGGFGTSVSPVYKLPGYNTVDFDLALYMPHQIQLDLFMKNLTDVAGQINGSPIAYNPTAAFPVAITQPRTVGMTLRAHFD